MEGKLEAACDNLGRMMAKQTAEVKNILRILKKETEEFCEKAMQERNQYIDKASLFVLAITLDDNLKSIDELQAEAQKYLEADKAYTTALMEKLMSQVGS
jgi:hypothetical protein